MKWVIYCQYNRQHWCKNKYERNCEKYERITKRKRKMLLQQRFPESVTTRKRKDVKRKLTELLIFTTVNAGTRIPVLSKPMISCWLHRSEDGVVPTRQHAGVPVKEQWTVYWTSWIMAWYRQTENHLDRNERVPSMSATLSYLKDIARYRSFNSEYRCYRIVKTS